MLNLRARPSATGLSLMVLSTLVVGLSAGEASAQVRPAVIGADAADGEVTEVQRRRRRRAVDDEEAAEEYEEDLEDAYEEEYDDVEVERDGDQTVVVVEQEDKFGPLYCAVCSCLAPPLWPLWVILMIVVDNEVPPVDARPADGPPSFGPLDERRNATAQAY